uniref:DUF4220 domain-containing protein n=1 Tax=Oryza rufipogon TaxID=4529 RepID=A0A0E0PKA2_ORYRU
MDLLKLTLAYATWLVTIGFNLHSGEAPTGIAPALCFEACHTIIFTIAVNTSRIAGPVEEADRESD